MAAARWGAREAALRRVPLRLVHAVDWPISPAIPRLGHEAADRWADEALTDALEDVRPRHPDVEITTRCLSGRPAAALAAEAIDAGLLVLGSRGRSTPCRRTCRGHRPPLTDPHAREIRPCRIALATTPSASSRRPTCSAGRPAFPAPTVGTTCAGRPTWTSTPRGEGGKSPPASRGSRLCGARPPAASPHP
ncbi:universal stress protein [Streptomyces sp. AB3(2024)]|uniref:universal stress protein n=1 Tax=Streptomyces sp. AB3(2024) TaxID=3317321 RepID=UPI0035A306F2